MPDWLRARRLRSAHRRVDTRGEVFVARPGAALATAQRRRRHRAAVTLVIAAVAIPSLAAAAQVVSGDFSLGGYDVDYTFGRPEPAGPGQMIAFQRYELTLRDGEPLPPADDDSETPPGDYSPPAPPDGHAPSPPADDNSETPPGDYSPPAPPEDDPPSRPGDDPLPDLRGVATLFVNGGLLAEWRDRAVNGPYRVEGDVSANSPGDWIRIVAEKNQFMANPSASRWDGLASWERNTTDSGCVADPRPEGNAPWIRQSRFVNSAAFYALVKRDHAVAKAAAAELVAQVGHGDTDFTDRDRFCLDSGPRGDSVVMAFTGDWIAGKMVAYDFLQAYEQDTGRTLFSRSQEQAFGDWVAGYATWVHHHVDKFLDELFVNRDAGDYTLTRRGQSTPDHAQRLYDGGPVPTTVSTRYNNRSARGMRGAGLAAALVGNERLIADNKRFWTELITFAYFPQGAVSDFERWASDTPTKGWKYAAEMLAPMATIAEVLANRGDTDLYTFSTTAGSYQTMGMTASGARRSLGRAIHDLFRYVAEDFDRTAGNGLIHPASVWVHELMLIHANAFYEDSYVRQTYLRQNTDPYPGRPRESTSDPWRGDGGIFPGALFMFGRAEQLS